MAPIDMRVTNTSSTESTNGGDVCDNSLTLSDRNDVQESDNEMPARINTWQMNVER